jgi:hypothetical protein
VEMVEALYTMNKVSVELNTGQLFDLDLKTFYLFTVGDLSVEFHLVTLM